MARKGSNGVVARPGQDAVGDAGSLVVFTPDDPRRVEGCGDGLKRPRGIGVRGGERGSLGHGPPVTGDLFAHLVLLLVQIIPVCVPGGTLTVPEVSSIEVSPQGGVCSGSVEVSADRGQGHQGADIQQPQDSEQELWGQDRQAKHWW